jgi:hypothetical protein
VTSIRQNKTFIATGDEAGQRSDQPRHEGNVVLTSSDRLEASRQRHVAGRGHGAQAGPVIFKVGRISGSVDLPTAKPATSWVCRISGEANQPGGGGRTSPGAAVLAHRQVHQL